MADLDFHGLQPDRPFKRSASQVNGVLPEQKNKRQKLDSSAVENWLRRTPGPLFRRRSDSFLLTGNLYDCGLLALEMAERVPSQGNAASNPALQSFPSSSHRDSSSSGSRSSSKKQSRVQHPLYREDLANHRVHIDPFGIQMPQDVREFVQNLLSSPGDSPEPTDEKLIEVRTELYSLLDADEGALRGAAGGNGLFPAEAHYNSRPCRGCNIRGFPSQRDFYQL